MKTFSPKELADMIGMSQTGLARWRKEGGGPEWMRMGGAQSSRIRYLESDVLAWIAECRKEKDNIVNTSPGFAKYPRSNSKRS